MACTYPVTPNSDPKCILQAFIDSGYYGLLNASQRAAAQADPVGWLIAHPYLYSAYPSFFAQATGSGSPLQDLFGKLNAVNSALSGSTGPQGTPKPLIIPSSVSSDAAQASASAPQSADSGSGSGVMGFISRYWLWIVVGVVAVIAIWYVVKRG
jgi:hypothetical protein